MMVEVREMRRGVSLPEIKPLDQCDFGRDRTASSLAWLLHKAYSTESIPEELREPFYTDQYDQEHVKPPVIRLLLSSDIYCRACGRILGSQGEVSPPPPPPPLRKITGPCSEPWPGEGFKLETRRPR